MRRIALCLAPAILLTGCNEPTKGEAVRGSFENKAAAIDAQAAQQPNETARKIYESRADAIREEGEDRKKGLEGGEPSAGQGASAPSG